ncbi:MAG TPA: ATP-binding cassette domain-containing protein [Candidatus Limiplasma sp.]|nr:ATP-binding cassette domain-containing protein [Candidatus Limiplasma sp.]HRX08648.1 ATP-binding cassette domain-containing protein [Candidatus Limiplasma sp.]
MAKDKKASILKQFSPYLGKKKLLLPLSFFLSAVSAVLSILPFVFLWYIARDILQSPQTVSLDVIGPYAWYAFGSALAGVLLYFIALLSSHLAAFHVEVEMQRIGMRKIISMPLGFFDQHASGKLRKIVNDGAGTTHTFLAHQLPDMAASVVSPVILLTLILLIDWRMGLAFSIYTYFVFLLIAARIYNPLIEVMNNLALLIYLNVRINRMREMDAMPRQEGASTFHPKNYDIVFHNVDFSYQEGVQTLRNISFSAKQGEVTALVGPSGGGKSTVAKLSARFWDIDKGVITLGGEDISKIDPETLLHSYSIVFQDVTLFNTSVMENIRLGKKGATDDEVIHAARLAQCDDFVSKLPMGYQTLIGENGERLSGGERQRISIARAILKDAPIILLDEATASLDAENESKIQKALSALIENKTVLVIAHRMRTVASANKIVVIKDGAIVETGSPEELKQQQGLYTSLLNAQ